MSEITSGEWRFDGRYVSTAVSDEDGVDICVLLAACREGDGHVLAASKELLAVVNEAIEYLTANASGSDPLAMALLSRLVLAATKAEGKPDAV